MSVLTIDARTDTFEVEDVEIHIDLVCERCNSGLSLTFEQPEVDHETPPMSLNKEDD
jgi:hypothetical protein